MTRERRSEIVRARITPRMRQQLELDLRERSNVLSVSDYLFELVEQDQARKEAIRISRGGMSRAMANE